MRPIAAGSPAAWKVPPAATATSGAASDARPFWTTPQRRRAGKAAPARQTLRELVDRLNASPGTVLFDAIESGVPTSMVALIAEATGDTAAQAMDLVGVSLTTLRRKEEAGEPLPDVAGHRVMAFLRVLATLRRLLAESGDVQALARFDLEGWTARWMRQPQPDLGGKTPAQLLRNPEGQRAIEELLERMRGGLPA